MAGRGSPLVALVSRLAGSALRAAALFGLLLLPLLYGGDRPMLWHVQAALLGALVLLARRPENGGAVGPSPAAAALFAVVALWCVVQMLPGLPPPLAAPAWEVASAALGQPLPGRISIAPEQTRLALLRMLTDAAAFWLGWALFRDSDGRRLVLGSVAGIAAAVAGYGLAEWALGNTAVLGIAKFGHHDALTGSFFGRNAFATFLTIGLLATLDLLLRALRQREPGEASLAVSRAGALALGLVLLVAALALTRSRSGIVLAALGAALLVGLRLARRWRELRPTGERRRGVLPLILGGMGLLAAAGLGAALLLRAGTWDRLGRLIEDGETRLAVAALTWRAALDRPLTGHGAGTFEAMFPAYRDGIRTWAVWDNAHNIYVEAMAGLGLPMALALFGAVLLAIRAAARGWWRLGSAGGACRVAIAAAFVVLAQGLQEFALLVPGVSIPFWTLLGLAAAAGEGPAGQSDAGSPAAGSERLRPGGAG